MAGRTKVIVFICFLVLVVTFIMCMIYLEVVAPALTRRADRKEMLRAKRAAQQRFAVANPLIVRTLAGDEFQVKSWAEPKNLIREIQKQHPILKVAGGFDLTNTAGTRVDPKRGSASRDRLYEQTDGATVFLTFSSEGQAKKKTKNNRVQNKIAPERETSVT